jgi:hypothetical protein
MEAQLMLIHDRGTDAFHRSRSNANIIGAIDINCATGRSFPCCVQLSSSAPLACAEPQPALIFPGMMSAHQMNGKTLNGLH